MCGTEPIQAYLVDDTQVVWTKTACPMCKTTMSIRDCNVLCWELDHFDDLCSVIFARGRHAVHDLDTGERLFQWEIGNRTDAYDLMERWRSQRFNPSRASPTGCFEAFDVKWSTGSTTPPSPSRWCDQLLDEENFRLAYQNLVSLNGRFLMINDPLDKPMAALAPYADWALRLVFAATFLFYGYNKATD